jgi:hypothetical protein
MNIVTILKKPITEEIIEAMGFTDYDDEHCTWGNRRLFFGAGSKISGDPWYQLQIIDYEDWPDEHEPEFNDCFYYSGWFELIKDFRTDGNWRLNTVKDIYKIIYLYHREWLPEFKQILLKLK